MANYRLSELFNRLVAKFIIYTQEYNNGNSGTSATIDWANGSKQKITFTGNCVLTFADISPSSAVAHTQLRVLQDSTGSRTLSEIITEQDATIATTDVDTTDDEITTTLDLPTGSRITFATTDTIPGGLTAGTVYWAINVDSTTIQVASSFANAQAGTQIDITSQGAGTHTVNNHVRWVGGTLPTLTTQAGGEDTIGFYKNSDGYWIGVESLDFS